MTRLKDKTAVITGGSGGIGRAAGKLFAAEGASVLLVDLDEAALAGAVAEIGSNRVSAVAGDVTRAGDVERYSQVAAERYGGIDIALLNAGIEGKVLPMVDYPDELFDRLMAVNVRGVWLGLKAAIGAMRKRSGGSIVVTSSVAGLRGAPNLAPYVASKHAVIGLVRSAALEEARHNIRVNAINPAPIDTRMIHALEEGIRPADPTGVRKSMEASLPMKRYGRPEEVAKLMLFLASEDSSYCTGGSYLVDGGVMAGRVS